MKKILIITAIIGLALASCSKDKEQTIKNAYVYDGTTYVISGAFFQENLPHWLNLIITPSNRASLQEVFDDKSDNFYISISAELLGTKIDLNVDNGGPSPVNGIFFRNEVLYRFEEKNKYGNLSGSDNWVKVTKNSAGNFTLEFGMTLEGKRLEGNYTGNFTESFIIG